MPNDDDEIDPMTGLSKKAARNLAKLAQTDTTMARTLAFSDEEKRVIDAAIDQIRAQVAGVVRIELFGSRARDNFRPDSDYDMIAVLPPSEEMPEPLETVNVPGADIQVIVAPEGQYEDWLDGAATVKVWPNFQGLWK